MELLNPSCPNLRILWPKVFPKSLSRTTLLQACPQQSWAAKIPNTAMKAVELNDCLLMQLIHQHDSQQLNPSWGQNQLTRPILMQTHVASVTILQSLSSQLNKLMRMHAMNPSNPSQMHQLCLGPLPGMTLLLTKPVF